MNPNMINVKKKVAELMVASFTVMLFVPFTTDGSPIILLG